MLRWESVVSWLNETRPCKLKKSSYDSDRSDFSESEDDSDTKKRAKILGYPYENLEDHETLKLMARYLSIEGFNIDKQILDYFGITIFTTEMEKSEYYTKIRDDFENFWKDIFYHEFCLVFSTCENSLSFDEIKTVLKFANKFVSIVKSQQSKTSEHTDVCAIGTEPSTTMSIAIDPVAVDPITVLKKCDGLQVAIAFCELVTGSGEGFGEELLEILIEKNIVQKDQLLAHKESKLIESANGHLKTIKLSQSSCPSDIYNSIKWELGIPICSICNAEKVSCAYTCGHIACGDCAKLCENCHVCRKSGNVIPLFF